MIKCGGGDCHTPNLLHMRNGVLSILISRILGEGMNTQGGRVTSHKKNKPQYIAAVENAKV